MTKRRRNILLAAAVAGVALIVFAISAMVIPGEADKTVRAKVLSLDSTATISGRTLQFSSKHLFMFRYKIQSANTPYKAIVWHAIPHNEVELEQ